ncbi:hypothetical protein GCM10027577_34490 [Spirosoma fluminis]
MIRIAQQFEVMVTGKRPDVVLGIIENGMKIGKFIFRKGHTNNANEHKKLSFMFVVSSVQLLQTTATRKS